MERDDIHRRAPEAPLSGSVEPPVIVHERGPHGGAEPRAESAFKREGDDRARRDPSAIRADDTEPYSALQKIALLFKIGAMVVVVALAAEILAGVLLEGIGALVPLLTEVVRGVVLAAFLWGAGDVTLLLIDVGHDVRAARILLGRLSARANAEAFGRPEREGRREGAERF